MKTKTYYIMLGELKVFMYIEGKQSIFNVLEDALAESEAQGCDQFVVDDEERLLAVARYRHFDEQNRFHRQRIVYTPRGLELYEHATKMGDKPF